MATMNTARNAQLVEQILQQVDRRVEGAERDQLTPFVQAFYSSGSAESLRSRDILDVYATTYQLWRFIQQFDVGSPKVALFNPVYEQHGWQSHRSVVAALVEDSPFVIDSMRIALNQRGIAIHNIDSGVLTVSRCDEGEFQGIQAPGKKLRREKDQHIRQEALVFIEITRQSDDAVFAEIQADLEKTLLEVRAVVSDFGAMKAANSTVIDILESKIASNDDSSATGQPSLDQHKVVEAIEYLSWLADDHFTFLGCQQFTLPADGALPTAKQMAKGALGIFNVAPEELRADVCHELAQLKGDSARSDVLSFSKSSVRAIVHRDTYPDYVSVRLPGDKEGEINEYRFLGMYTSKAYSLSPNAIPVIREKVKAIEAASGLDMAGHDGKELAQIINTFPRDELIQGSVKDLHATIDGIWRIQERRKVRMFLREDHFGKFLTCMVYTPRDIFKTEVREKIEAILSKAFNATDVDFTTRFSESILTQTHFVFRIDPRNTPAFDLSELQAQVSRAAQQWPDLLEEALLEEHGEEKGTSLARTYQKAFPAGYREDFEPHSAIYDIEKIERLDDGESLELKVYRVPEEPDHMLHFRLYHLGEPLVLSDLLPPLENMGVIVCGDRSYEIQRSNGQSIWMHDFTLSYGLANKINLDDVRGKFVEAFRRTWEGDAENDAFNKLILGTQLDWREVALLRSYARYMKQIGFNFREEYIAETLGRYLALTNCLASLFKQRFDPTVKRQANVRSAGEIEVLKTIKRLIDEVENLNEDSIFRQYLALIDATLRTNYFQRDANGQLKGYFSFKLAPGKIPNVPAPVPMYEIFVYSPKVEGVHLRGGKVARGGLRWSDRGEDFRTEVLGLVKAQQVKNAVIVPVGAKGGFYPKTIPANASREQLQELGIAAYKTFISGLLDVTDNMVNDMVAPPVDVVRHDGDDPYLVVAADKGTATFSDIANALSEQYGFWLGDAFASGGSIGYDHKGMGITAKGAWVSVQRLFRERGVNVQTTDFSVVGIGDMMGDVFGNGMLLSEHICLKAAFNHLHIIIDPTPDSAKSFEERKRLFEMKRSSWDDYNKRLISQGGGLFLRSAKSIPISPEMKEAFMIEADALSPNELIKALLKAPVDLLWNGGIGTYIKASSESHADVGDKANDILRVNGKELRCRVIGEGGNLGVTQLARTEYALNGGAMNTDFIDNSAGVDCSDHEVNIKILLNDVKMAGDITEKQRRKLLESMTDEVGELVLVNNYRQVQAISIAENEANLRYAEYRRLITVLEESGKLDRALEFLPSEEALLEREAKGDMLTRPELSVLISYIKSQLKEDLNSADIYENPYVANIVRTAFPKCLAERYPDRVAEHKLHREIIATQLANDMVNHMGLTFVSRMMQSPGTSVTEVALAYVSAREVFSVPKYWAMIEALDHQVDTSLQMKLMADLMRLTRRASHWFLRHRQSGLNPENEVRNFLPAVNAIKDSLSSFLQGHLKESWQARHIELQEQSVPEQIAHFIAGAPTLYSSLSIAEAAKKTKIAPEQVAEVYFSLGEALDLHWFNKQISSLPVKSQWQALAREAYRDDLEALQGEITASLLVEMGDRLNGDMKAGVEQWMKKHGDTVNRWKQLVADIRGANTADFSIYTVANRSLTDLAMSCDSSNARH